MPLPRTPFLLTLVVGWALAGAPTPSAQPAPLRLGAPAGADADRVFPVGWSPDGRYLAFVGEFSGEGATAAHLRLRVQDLTSDEFVVDEMLTPGESEVDPNLGRVWREQQNRLQHALRLYSVQSSAVTLQPLPYGGQPGGPYTTVLSLRRDGGRVSGYTLGLRDGQGRAKTLEAHTFEYAPAYGVRVLGVLAAPSDDRVAVVVEVVASGYEGGRTYEYRLVGARTGAEF